MGTMSPAHRLVRARRVAAMGALASCVLLGACGTATDPAVTSPAGGDVSSNSAAPVPAGTASVPPGLAFAPLTARPAERPQAALDLAFDAANAASLLAAAPEAIDFSTSALLCVYLGERAGSWSLTLVSAALEGGTLRVRAREAPPRGTTGGARTTYPASCGTIDRRALPAGTLAVRADDTVSGEFIVAATVTVPAP
jgi:hypothetical protein